MRFKVHFFIEELENLSAENSDESSFAVRLEWRGSGGRQFGFLPTRIRKNSTSRKHMRYNGIVSWDEGFSQTCLITQTNDQKWRSYILNLEIQEFKQNQKGKCIIEKTSIDLSERVERQDEGNSIRIPIVCSIRGQDVETILKAELHVMELQRERITFRRITSKLARAINSLPLSYKRMHIYPSEDEQYSEVNYDTLERVNITLDDQAADEFERQVTGREFYPERSSGTIKERRSLAKLLPNNRTLSFKGSSHHKGELLLDKASNAEFGGDDIDNERLQVMNFNAKKLEPNSFIFEDREFEIGVWENKKIMSRDGELELTIDVMLASVDQRDESVAGDSACTVLAVVIANWLHNNPKMIPLKCQLDELIHEGSLAWRQLCKDESLKTRFPDQHFDLETVLQVNVCSELKAEMPLVAFFSLDDDHDTPGGLKECQKTMSFDTIWDQITECAANEEIIYITSWNDHFFVLKIEKDTIYLIDTYGERLFEGCKKAYILKFHQETVICRSSREEKTQAGGSSNCNKDCKDQRAESSHGSNLCRKDNGEPSDSLICEGINSCREYIGKFLAGLPLRELQQDIKNRAVVDDKILNRLVQIEFHHTTINRKARSHDQVRTEL